MLVFFSKDQKFRLKKPTDIFILIRCSFLDCYGVLKVVHGFAFDRSAERMGEMQENKEAIVGQYGPMVYRLAYSMVRVKSEADDLFQEVFLRYFKKQRYFSSEEHRKAWLIRVTVNCVKKFWSSAWVQKVQDFPEDLPFQDIHYLELDEALKKLSVSYRTVIHLFYFEDMSIEQIGCTLSRKPSTVRTQLTRARVQLRELLKEEYGV